MEEYYAVAVRISLELTTRVNSCETALISLSHDDNSRSKHGDLTYYLKLYMFVTSFACLELFLGVSEAAQ
jgi:hypothetical protein